MQASGQYTQQNRHLLHFSSSSTGRKIRQLPVLPTLPSAGTERVVTNPISSSFFFLFSFGISLRPSIANPALRPRPRPERTAQEAAIFLSFFTGALAFLTSTTAVKPRLA